MDRNTIISAVAVGVSILAGSGNYLHTDSLSADERAARHLEWRIRACEIDELVAKTDRPDLVEYCTLEALKAVKKHNGG